MSKFSKILPLIIILSATSCGASLREDIADFIKSFNYQTARETVIKGSFKDENKGQYQGHDFVVIDEVSFDVSITNVVMFKHYYKSLNYPGNVDEEFEDTVTTIEGKYIYRHKGVDSEITYQEAYDKTNLFFYLNYYPDTGHHDGGMYYGDIVKAEAGKQQQFLTVNESKTELRYYVENVKTNDSVITMDWAVDTLGMFIYVKDGGYSTKDPTTYFNETITVDIVKK